MARDRAVEDGCSADCNIMPSERAQKSVERAGMMMITKEGAGLGKYRDANNPGAVSRQIRLWGEAARSKPRTN